MKYTYKEYMLKEGIKSRNTVKARVKNGIVKELKENNKVYIIDNNISQIDNDFNNEININNYKMIINDLKREIEKLRNENKILNIQLENKEKFISNLELENKNKQDIILGLQQQISEINKNNMLLLENKKNKSWFQFWK